MEIEGQDIHQELKVFQEQVMKKDTEEGQDGVKGAGVMYPFKNTIYIYVDNVSEKLQYL